MQVTSVAIPTQTEPLSLSFIPGKTTVFIGANGSGKTRLGIYIEKQLSPNADVHRIAAHRSLAMNTSVTPQSLDEALQQLRYGSSKGTAQNKEIVRWQQKPATLMLSDFEHLIRALYAEENHISVKFRQDYIRDPSTTSVHTKLDVLQQAWQELLPHRQLLVEASKIKTAPAGMSEAAYDAAEMSDGERVIFYLLGQALLAEPGIILVFDEPELHINRSILAKLWDKIEAVRNDCAFIYITHDVDFASSRRAADKFVLRSYKNSPEQWDIEQVPENTSLPDDVLAMIVGSRQPVLFVEGDGGSLDAALYRKVFHRFTVIPVGSCEHVIHTVETFARRSELHRVGCAGIIDADGRTPEEALRLASKSIYVLPVSEVENLLLLPSVFRELAKSLHYTDEEADTKLEELKSIVFAKADVEIDRISLDHTRRRIDALSKKIGLRATAITDLAQEFASATASIDPTAIYNEILSELRSAVDTSDYETILRLFDNKGLLKEAAPLLRQSKKSLEEFVGRALRSDAQPQLLAALTACLPTPTPRP